jgi:hypothetical protein
LACVVGAAVVDDDLLLLPQAAAATSRVKRAPLAASRLTRGLCIVAAPLSVIALQGLVT